jgi:hypothetical protein
MVLVLIPVLVWIMWHIQRHYRNLAQQSVPETPLDPNAINVRAIVPIANLGLPARQAIAYAQAIVPPERVVAVHVTDNDTGAQQFREAWQAEGRQVHMVIVESPFRSLVGPLLAYIDAVRETHPKDTITVILPEYVAQRWWEHLLHNHTALRLKGALLFHPGVVVTSVPYHMRPSHEAAERLAAEATAERV